MKPMASVLASCSAAHRLKPQQCRQPIDHFHDDIIPRRRVLEVTICLWSFELLDLALHGRHVPCDLLRTFAIHCYGQQLIVLIGGV
jgi:hypothetical protein